ncbi:MAG: ATP-binding protein [Defluviitaleaceae bacterium]|nr:ATP-binding protein [Defluviitaleaceae bacterium]MCL2263083.1 ATP-binding protein [Defluviitaleaceae bacterium]
MKGKKVSTKLTMSFSIVIALTFFVGVAGVIGMVQINRGSMEMYESQSQPLADLGMAREYFQRLRVQLRDIVLASGDLEALALIEADLYNHERGFVKNIESYRQTIYDPEILELYYDIMFIFAAYQPGMQQIIASARVHAPPVQMILMMNDLVVPTDFIMEALDYLAYERVRQAAHANEVNRILFSTLFIAIIAVIAVILAVGILVTKNVSVLSKLEFSRLADENATLESLSRMKSEYLANISHETKTPLTLVSVDVQLVNELLTDAKIEGGEWKLSAEDGLLIREAMERAQNAILRAGRITESNLRLASMQENREKITVIDISKLVTSSAEIRRGVAEKQGNRLNINVPDNLPRVFGNIDNLTQVVDNLLTNANNNTKGGDITIAASANEKFIIVTVTDSGTGISPDILPFVFKRGISGSGGTGIGLALCRSMVEAHGGDISLESEQGKGTAVTFTLPIYNAGGEKSHE